MRRGRGLIVAAVVMLATAAAACSDTGRGRTLDLGGSPTPSSDTATGSVHEWIAVFRTAPDASDLNEDTSEVLPVAGEAIVVSPAACFEGLPSDIPLDSYVLGVVAPTRAELDQVVASAGRAPLFEGPVRTMCLD